MPNRSRPHVISVRVTAKEKALLSALSEMNGVSQSELIHRRLIPWVRERVVSEAEESSGGDLPPAA